MPIPVELLLCILLIVLILAALRLYTMLGGLKEALANIEQTRQEVTGTVQKLDVLLTDEVAPTLQVARQTLANVEITTKALADTTLAARRMTVKTEAIAQAAQILFVGGAAAKRAIGGKASPVTKSRRPLSKAGLLANAGIGLLGLLAKRRTKK